MRKPPDPTGGWLDFDPSSVMNPMGAVAGALTPGKGTAAAALKEWLAKAMGRFESAGSEQGQLWKVFEQLGIKLPTIERRSAEGRRLLAPRTPGQAVGIMEGADKRLGAALEPGGHLRRTSSGKTYPRNIGSVANEPPVDAGINRAAALDLGLRADQPTPGPARPRRVPIDEPPSSNSGPIRPNASGASTDYMSKAVARPLMDIAVDPEKTQAWNSFYRQMHPEPGFPTLEKLIDLLVRRFGIGGMR